MKNIYDMSGNVYEWTMAGYHYSDSDWRMSRGAYAQPTTKSTTSYRNACEPGQTYDKIGFRIALYII